MQSLLSISGLYQKLKSILGQFWNLFPLGGANGGIIVRQKGGTPGTNEVQILQDGTGTNITNKDANSNLFIVSPGSVRIGQSPSGYLFNTGSAKIGVGTSDIVWNNNGDGSGNAGPSLSQVNIGSAGGVIRTCRGNSTGVSWVQNTAARARLTADVTESAGTLTNLTDLSITLIAGRKYFGRLVIFCNESTAADGIQLDFNGGSSTMTSFRAFAGCPGAGGSVVSGVNVSTSLSTALTFTTFTGEGCITIEFGLVCNAGGTLIPRFSQVAHSTGTATVRLNSWLLIEDSPN